MAHHPPSVCRPRRGRRRRRHQTGQIATLFSLCILTLLFAAALPLDAGYAFVLYREAQNAADFGARAASADLAFKCTNSSQTVATSTVVSHITPAVKGNVASIDPAPSWKGRYIDWNGSPTGAGSPALVPDMGSPIPADAPANACGADIEVTAHRHNLLAALMGFDSIQVQTSARARGTWRGGVVALAPWGLHTLHAAGIGSFTVNGDVWDNSTGCNDNSGSLLTQDDAGLRDPATGVSCFPGAPTGGRALGGEDTVDSIEFDPRRFGATGVNAVRINGYIHSPLRRPLDTCHYLAWTTPNGQLVNEVGLGVNPPGYVNSDAFNNVYSRPRVPPNPFPGPFSEPSATPLPPGAECISFSRQSTATDLFFRPHPGAGRFATDYTGGRRIGNPLARIAPPNPARPDEYCPTGGDYNNPTYIAGDLYPGTYENPAAIKGTATLHDCGGYPGIYTFKKGVEICPQAGQSVTGRNVLIYSASAFGGPRGFPDGLPLEAPFAHRIPHPGCNGLGVIQPFRYTDRSGNPQTVYENDDQILDAGFYGSGTYGITVGGTAGSQVVLGAPTSGPWHNILLYQDPRAAANIGLDAFAGDRLAGPRDDTGLPPDTHDGFRPNGDGANLTLTGAIYNDSLASLDAGKRILGKFTCLSRVNAGFGGGVDEDRDPDPLARTTCSYPLIPTAGAEILPSYVNGRGLPGCAKSPAFPSGCNQQILGPDPNGKGGDLWRVTCTPGTPNSNAGRLQIGQTVCQNDAESVAGLANPTISLHGPLIVDIFDITGGANIGIDAPATVDTELLG